MYQNKQTSKTPKILVVLFVALAVNFVALIAAIFIDAFRELIRPAFLYIMFSYSIIGLVLLILTYKSKISTKLRKALLLTSASAFGFVLFSVLHNVFYALAEFASGMEALVFVLQALEVVFFFVSIVGCPIGYIVGSVKSIVLLVRKS